MLRAISFPSRNVFFEGTQDLKELLLFITVTSSNASTALSGVIRFLTSRHRWIER
ncbi:hypothetical protein N431DRAFT_218521 [Stipitochalara longipes BDJ]|nr:hypothetical protein N431DRAFT_218521 [Stipitochalara longipes BDJ]